MIVIELSIIVTRCNPCEVVRFCEISTAGVEKGEKIKGLKQASGTWMD